MKKPFVFPFLLLILFLIFSSYLFCTSQSANAETRYVSGVIVVNLRNTNEEKYKVLDSVESGDKVEVLEEKGRFAKVKTKDNIEGWLPIQYLKKGEPAIETIARLKDEIADLKMKNDHLEAGNVPAGSRHAAAMDEQEKKTYEKNIESLKAENNRLLEDNQNLLKTLQKKDAISETAIEGKQLTNLKEKVAILQNQLEILRKNSKNVIQITKERDRFAAEVATLQSDLTQSRDLNKKLEKDKMLHWFFAGAIVFFLGFLTSKLFVRRKSKLSF